jgi:hypothetical protein
MYLSITSTIIYTVVVASLFGIAFRFYKKKTIDKKFNCQVSGGRSGEITIEVDGKNAKCEYEVGSKVSFIIYESSLRWCDGKDLESKEKNKLKTALMKWSSARRSSLKFAKDT